ncbi:MAG: tetratricopeptide repeat protein [Hydrogenophaga sp.]|uniref:tetratricopeptide repeat protein n=1 Tax=Hydrogenophaga sp. TaxID=1904254 RepID=UPI00169A0FFC|nr:tetratricopeptide repeat protein [Hydrogenophaga sp.]NIM42712.1 tetratricopeptide repeat protein [Hydrogenophaga sp.]NIN25755.1 tetratricopeptide repeat protein [Hydrogenophaga sp.]NIN30417.1 tetratricopeptide repeat protein [Hydrogenophaga sp.]NIN56757.1 tetratricopeptide repeat protein [Hydrogenophaga sp.]NIO53332.1 tetratricopeptide repeat protein [Hydrogenophaga sp.]
MKPLPLHSRLRRSLVALACAGVLASPGAQAQSPLKPSATRSALDAALFYQLLLGELNVRGGDPGAGYSLILEAAQREKNPELFRRAVEVALQSRQVDAALAAATTWARDIPGDADANRFTLLTLLSLGRVNETAPALRAVLQATPAEERNGAIAAIPQMYARATDKAQVLSTARDALGPFLNQPAHAGAAWATIGRLELDLDRPVAASDAARRGHAADPVSPYPALLALELLERGQADTELVVRQHIDAARAKDRQNTAIATAYARVLFDLGRLRDARVQLERLTTQAPQQPEPWLLLGMLQVRDNALPAANVSLDTYLQLARDAKDERERRSLTQAYLLKAEIAEKQQDFVAANAWLDRIDNPEELMAAQLRRASVLARQGRLDDARALLRSQPERRPDDARLKLISEAQLLREFKAWREAYQVYGEAVQRFPEDPDLLYEQAMMGDRAGMPAEMERLLRELIAAKPDHHHAYNALGYSLADRNERLPEAKQLIEKAVSMAPDDAYIQDSLGWVEFRLGNTERALDILRQAYGKRPDPEIAAHLGEVLWAKGERDEARRVWREGLALASDNETLRSTLKRLNVEL